MTGWRACIEVIPEKTFGVIPIPEGANKTVNDIEWKYLGPGATFNFSGNNNWKYQNGIGNKKPELQLEGRFTSSWAGSVYLDYNNFYWLYMCFEGYENPEDYTHTFSLLNNTPTRSFSMRVTRLDEPVGGDGAMQTILVGCRVNSFGWNYENSSGGLKCDFGGNCVNWYPTKQNIDSLPIYRSGTNKQEIKAVNWGCFRIKDAESDDSYHFVANNERATWKVNRTVNTVPNSCGRIDKASYESALQPISLTSQIYSNTVDEWMSRFRNGGALDSDAISTLATNFTEGMPERALKPIYNIMICSHDGKNSNADDATDMIKVEFKNVGVDSWGNSYNTGSEIVENPNMKAMDMTVTIISQKWKNAIDTEVTEDFGGQEAQQNM